MSDKHIRRLRDDARRSRARLADHAARGPEGAEPAAQRRADLERASRSAAARLAAAEARRGRDPERERHKSRVAADALLDGTPARLRYAAGPRALDPTTSAARKDHQ